MHNARQISLQSSADFVTPPYGGRIVDLVVQGSRATELRRQSSDWASWTLSPRQLCDLELLVTGAFSPLEGFMTERDFTSVCRSQRLTNGMLWPIPIVLDVKDAVARSVDVGGTLALRDPEGRFLAALHVEEIWRRDKAYEARCVFGTEDTDHPGVAALAAGHVVCVGGRIEAVEAPVHYDFRRLRRTPSQLRADLELLGWTRVVAFQTRNPMHRAHIELTRRAIEETGARLLIHPVVGMTRPGDVDHFTRVRCYQAVLRAYPSDTATLALLPLAMRMAGPREAVLHAIIRRNYGCTHLIVGRDHAGPGTDARGVPFYGPYDAQALLNQYQAEIGVQMVPSLAMVYVADQDRYVQEDKVEPGTRTASISGTDLRRRLARGEPVPEWFSPAAVVDELQRTYPPRRAQGFTVFFTGLSGSGKSTIANVLLVRLMELDTRKTRLLDGDIVRTHLSSELGFSKEHRDLNIQRIGFVASEITRCGGAVLCAAIAPYDAARRSVRAMVESEGGYILVHVSTALEVCEQRDPKGLYAKARTGAVPHFTGISDPYEPPHDADLVIDTATTSAEDAAGLILTLLQERGYVAGSPQDNLEDPEGDCLLSVIEPDTVPGGPEPRQVNSP